MLELHQNSEILGSAHGNRYIHSKIMENLHLKNIQIANYTCTQSSFAAFI